MDQIFFLTFHLSQKNKGNGRDKKVQTKFKISSIYHSDVSGAMLFSTRKRLNVESWPRIPHTFLITLYSGQFFINICSCQFLVSHCTYHSLGTSGLLSKVDNEKYGQSIM